MRWYLRKTFWLKVAAVIMSIVVAFVALLSYPQLFFHWSVSANNLILYSDQPFTPEAGKKVLELAYSKLSTSPIYITNDHYRVFVCNARWRQRLFFLNNYGVGGVNYYPITSNMFIRGSIIDQDRVVSPSGKLVDADRPLDYYVAHEITHTLDKKAVGWFHHEKLPRWVREGYPDYVGKGSTFNFADAKKQFLAGVQEMDPQK